VAELNFRALPAREVPYAAAPTIGVPLELTARPADQPIQSVLLQTQVRIDAPQRSYEPGEREGLRELFGQDSQWSRSLQGMFWCQVSTVVRGFTGTGQTELLLPRPAACSTAAARYFDALQGGEVPLLLLFSGTIFSADADGALRAAPIAWSAESRCGVPISLLNGDRAPLSLDRGVFEKLSRYQRERGLRDVDAALATLLGAGS
jgi:hypothetical protein